MKEQAIYQVGLKVLLRSGEEVLLLTLSHEDGKYFDLPGGRIDEEEHETPLEEIIAREVREELGEAIVYRLGSPLFQFRRYNKNKNVYVFITVYEADFLSGEIALSDEHSAYQWIHPKEFALKRKNFSSEEQYCAFEKYFETLKQACP